MSPKPLSEKLIPCQLSRAGDHFIAYSRTPSQEKNLPEVLFLTGLRSDMMGTKAQALSDFCEERKQGFTRFDYHGHGFSSGEFADGTIGLWLEDTLEMIDKITEGPLILVGSSLGGWLACLAALVRPKRVVGLIGIAPAPDFTEELMWASFSDNQRKELISHGRTYLPNEYEGEDDVIVTLQLIEEARQHLILSRDIPIKCPVHLIHGTHDRDVPWSISQRLMEKLDAEDVQLTLIKDGDHRLSSPTQLHVLNEALQGMNKKKALKY